LTLVTTMLLTLGDLRRILREELQLERDEATTTLSIDVTYEDFFALAKLQGKKLSGNKWLAAATVDKKFESRPEHGQQNIDKVLLSLNQKGFKIEPGDVTGTLKKPRVVGKKGSQETVVLSMTPDNQKMVLKKLAATIATAPGIKGNVDVVVPIDSTSGAALQLASYVAAMLNKPLVKAVEKTLPTEYHYNEDLLNREEKDSDDPEKAREDLRQVLIKQDAKLNGMIARGEVPTSTDFPFSVRRFYNLLSVNDNIQALSKKKILVVDDNVREGVTFRQIEDELLSRGIPEKNVVYAVGYRLPQKKD
jgi:adenine/guanine phosphoribosyltransferase-like PRPP-binding protein